MGSRVELQTLLEETLGSDQVYFQPPDSVTFVYPCIVYSRDAGNTKFADDSPYTHKVRYQIKVIGKDPDSDVLTKVASLPMCIFDRHYVASNLHHDVYSMYY